MTSSDTDFVLARRHDNGGDFWASEDGRIYVGNPFSTIGSLLMLHELGVASTHEAVQGGLSMIRACCRDDGKIKVAPGAPLYPCYTAEAVRVMCRFGLTGEACVETALSYLTESTHDEGGWRCSFTRFGRGPETECANPGATLYVLDVLRFFPGHQSGSEVSDPAVDFLLAHWLSRKPAGPCHWGVGSQFLKVEFPFLRYNLFFYVYVLSFFDRARRDRRFSEAWSMLQAKRNAAGQLLVEYCHPRLRMLDFCARGTSSAAVRKRLEEITANLA